MNYQDFIAAKEFGRPMHGFKPMHMPSFLFDFQAFLVDWSIRIGRGAIFADCGMGKGPMALVWADNIVRKTNGNVLILTPLAVSSQFVSEGKKFGIPVNRLKDGSQIKNGINVINYQRLHYLDPKDWAGVVADEAGILKNFDGQIKRQVIQFLKTVKYRLLCTATPAPNDHMELGNSSEALGVMSRNQMLGMFFTNGGESTQQWELKGHARTRFWQWCSTWARAIRKPSDLGFDDRAFILPKLDVQQHVLPSKAKSGFFPEMAKTLEEQRQERKKTVKERCNKMASLVPKDEPIVIWCHLNSEADYLEKIIPDAVQVKGSDKDEVKEERLEAFSLGKIRILITKPKIASHGLNWQHCSKIIYLPSWSQEQYYQAIRRCWRFGQKKPVTCHLVYTEAESIVVDGMLRKERQAIQMYEGIVREMNFVQKHSDNNGGEECMKLPQWM